MFRRKQKSAVVPASRKSFVKEWFNAIVFAVVAATLIRWTTVEAFVVPTPSMENTILVGDYLFVSKMHYGTRTTTTPLQIPLTHQKIWGTQIPSYLDWINLPAYRLPGFSEVKREDLVVFNVPPLEMNDGVQYPVQLKTYFVKRCTGLPGDVLEIRDQQVYANGIPLGNPKAMKFSYRVVAREAISDRVLKHMGINSDDFYYLGKNNAQASVYHMFLTETQVAAFEQASYISATEIQLKRKGHGEDDIFPSSKASVWNGDNFGPLTIPAKGMTITINDSTLSLYGGTIVQYEGSKSAEVVNNQLIIDGQPVNQYTFRQNYYFMMGDNRHNSLDSRYWGFVPEDHIVGKPLFIWMSIESEASMADKIRWKRIFTRLR